MKENQPSATSRFRTGRSAAGALSGNVDTPKGFTPATGASRDCDDDGGAARYLRSIPCAPSRGGEPGARWGSINPEKLRFLPVPEKDRRYPRTR